ncbi:MAG: hypothetical protein LBV74_03005 [Tannerella sp.]|jgi:hypothetical protein|nr:hypothetical protein [Tannerella sp.]
MAAKKLFSSIVVVLVAILSLSSCEEVTYSSSLFCNFVSETDRNGYFEDGYVYTFNDLSNLKRSDDIVGMDYLGTTITFEGISSGDLRQGDVIKDVYIGVDGMVPFLFARNIAVLRDNERISYTSREDREFYDFMRNVMRRFYNHGKIDMMVYGWVTHNNVGVRNVRMRVTLDNLLDVTIVK